MPKTTQLSTLTAAMKQPKIMICAIPKSGNYVFAELLEALGMERHGFVFHVNGVSDRRDLSAEKFKNMDRTVRIPVPIQVSTKFLSNGQFGYGYLPCSHHTREILREFRIIFVKRNIRDVFTSHMRWTSRTVAGTLKTDSWRNLPDGPEKMLKYIDDIGFDFLLETCFPMIGWMRSQGVLTVSFEDLWADNGASTQRKMVLRIADACGSSVDEKVVTEILKELLGRDTFTWSGSRSNWKIVWDEQVEEVFTNIGGTVANKLLGYDD